VGRNGGTVGRNGASWSDDGSPLSCSSSYSIVCLEQ
jgi:hypothetical protein